ncbi:crotonase/enoyl-CoA hydratase family protein [Iamia majanohamensis]|uniref:Crotonase/enoyl-CoA hydratase family protein n=1 Tax=Iamia majanohamensis TaxID=467976 RepID=A0AAE9Y7R3_9ACTN|nr:crotonase/enoyl-CoA hydratase family protein [Iamia majanohamensis]WCO65983.1 crotonase/enoyl-CoA hydratase family protein [Iamia majanohamensis]
MADDPTPTRFEIDGDVAVLTLDDGKANAIGHATLDALHDAVERAEADASALVVAGGARAFSAGYDLAVMTESTEAMRGLVAAGARLLMRLYGASLPTIAACTGHALAGGALTLLACDERIGPDGAPAKIGLNEVAIGMPLPVFAVELARDRLSPRHLTAAVTGRVYDPAGAVEVGYLDRVVPPDQVVEAAMATARERAALRRGAVARTKSALRARTIDEVLATLDDDIAALTGPDGR